MAALRASWPVDVTIYDTSCPRKMTETANHREASQVSHTAMTEYMLRYLHLSRVHSLPEIPAIHIMRTPPNCPVDVILVTGFRFGRQ